MIPEIPRWTMAQLNLLDLGNTIQVAGVIYADAEVAYLCMMPEEPIKDKVLRVLDLDQEDWEKIIKQTDLVETEVLTRAPNGKLAKIIVRKSTRQIEQNVSWAVFRRDGYRCRYCGAKNRPLTVDHLVTWEDGGPSTEENLVACCRACNKARGNTPYEDWLNHPFYLKVSRQLEADVFRANKALADTLHKIPRRMHSRGRGGR